MYQEIPENITEILLKRLLIFVSLFVIVMLLLYFNQSLLFNPASSVNAFDFFREVNKLDVLLNA
jgi:hypothetical protein